MGPLTDSQRYNVVLFKFCGTIEVRSRPPVQSPGSPSFDTSLPTDARPVSGGRFVPKPDEGSPIAPDTVSYEVWTGGGRTWVELSRGEESPYVLDASSVDALTLVLDKHLPAPSIRSVSVGVRDGDVELGLSQDWPVASVGLAVLSVIGLLVSAVVTVQSRRSSKRAVALARREIEAREMERTRVAREIHDGALQDLALLARTADAEPGAIRDRIREVSADLRALATDLRPPALDRLGLGPALSDLADRWSRAPTPLAVRVDVPPDSHLTLEEEVTLYRIAQESLTNAARHGEARTAWLFVRLKDRGTELIARDDGVGLPDDVTVGGGGEGRLLDEGHYGLVGMAERARSIGATLHLSRGPGGLGTEVLVHIPLRRSS